MSYGELRHCNTTHRWKPAEQHVNQGLDNTGDSIWDHLIGAWSRDEAVELDEALQDSETIDESLWRSESSWIPRAKDRPIPTNDVWIAAHVSRHGEWSRPGIGGPPGMIRRRGARNREGECHSCNGHRRWPSAALPVAVYRDRGLGRSNFFRPMPGSRALDITELAHLVQ